MGKEYDQIDRELATWIASREMFFVATAPSGDAGLINCSPKGLDTFRVLDEKTVAYLDLTGSGIETIAHLKQNGRIVIMFCAFNGPPKILRIHGRGVVHELGTPCFEELSRLFGDLAGARAVIEVKAARITDSCGFGVPQMQLQRQRDTLPLKYEQRGAEQMSEYRRTRNAVSLDGLPGWESEGLPDA